MEDSKVAGELTASWMRSPECVIGCEKELMKRE